LVVDPVGNAYGQPLFADLFLNEFVTQTTYLNDLGVYDVAWGVGTFTNQNQRSFVQSFNPTDVIVPQHQLTNAFGTRFLTSFELPDAQSWAFIHPKSDLTNIFVQAVYVQTGDTNVQVDVRWDPEADYFNDIVVDPDNLYSSIIKLSSISTNALTLQIETNSFFIVDQTGSSTNQALLQNDRYPQYFRPGPIFVSRSEPFNFTFGTLSNSLATPDLFFGSGILAPNGFSNIVVTNFYAAYVFDLENLVYGVPAVPGASVHDLPGRVEIKGKNVDLTGTGIRGEGLVSIETDNLISTTNTVIDAQNLAFNLAYTNAAAPATPLRIQNLTKDRAARLHGQVEVWSGVFSNQFSDLNSNVFNVIYQVSIVDATALAGFQEVAVSDFQARTANLHLDDNMIVSNTFNITSSDVTVSGAVELRNTGWNTNAPNLSNLTIESTGRLTLPGLAEFGTAAKPLANFVDRGTITSYSQSIDADTVDISGTIASGENIFTLAVTPFGGLIFTNFFFVDSGPLEITANQLGRFNGATLETLGEVTLSGPVFKLSNTHIDAGDSINLNITSAYVDSGAGAANVLTSSNSLSLNTSASGSLLGTEIDALPPVRGTYRLRWAEPAPADRQALTNIPVGSIDAWVAATNRANSAFSSNLGIGHLVLQSGTNTVFEFSGTQQNRALYVDLLDIQGTGITNLTSLTNQLRLIANANSSIDIYYGDVIATNLQRGVNLGFQSMAEFLNGKQLGGGHLYWVGTFNGPNTSEDVVINGTSVRMNRALRHSQIIDLDQDGIANGNDDLPFQNGVSALQIQSINVSQVDGKAAVTFTAFQGTYQVQYTDSLQTPVWKQAGSYTNPNATGVSAAVTDTNPPSSGPRFYRLIYTPAAK
jgi:hypothetical protein